MKSLVILIAIISVGQSDSTPEFKTSFSFKSINDFKINIAKPFIDQLAHDLDIPFDLHFEKVRFAPLSKLESLGVRIDFVLHVGRPPERAGG